MDIIIFFLIGIFAACKALAMYADYLNKKEAKEHQEKYVELYKNRKPMMPPVRPVRKKIK